MVIMHDLDSVGIDPNLLPVLAALLRERHVSRAAERLRSPLGPPRTTSASVSL